MLESRALVAPYAPSMEQRLFGRTGLTVSVLGFGGAEIGFGSTDKDIVAKLLNEALDAGLNVIDTAECYVDSEEKIGLAVSHRRRDFHLFTKVGHQHGLSGGADWTEGSITATIERSLQRLKTDVLDLVQLHSCSSAELAKGECIEALEKARQAGKTRHIGYSGDGVDAVAAVRTGRFDTLQTSINIADQRVLNEALPLAVKAGMGVIAKRPIANAAWQHAEQPANGYHVEYWRRLKALDYRFLSKPLEEASAIALRFTLSQPGVHTAIVGTTKPGRFIKNAAAIKLGQLPEPGLNAIRGRWKAASEQSWVGQV